MVLRMGLKKYQLQQAKNDDSKPRLDNFLAEKLPAVLNDNISKGQIRKLIVAGAVYLNGKRVRIASKEIFKNARVEVYIDQQKLHTPQKEEQLIDVTANCILYEDEDILVANKPFGLATQPTVDKARNNFYTALQKLIRERGGSNEYLGLHHRLDRDTSGLLLFSRSQRANEPIAEMFREHNIVKSYVAICGHPNKLTQNKFIIKNFLKRDPDSAKKMARYTATNSGGDSAETHFEVLNKTSDFATVLCQPITGRTHQIRVHLSENGTPIWGDPLYGKSFSGHADRLMLHAWKLEFEHPTTGKHMLLSAPLPAEFERFF